MPDTIDPVKTDAADSNKAVLEQISSLTETLSGLTESVEAIQGDIDGIKNPPAALEKPSTYQPKTWDDIPKTAKEIAEQTYEEKETAKRDAEDKRKTEEAAGEKKIQEDINTQISSLEKSGSIPPIKDASNENDPGRSARRELFGLAADLGTTNLEKVAETMNNLNKQGIHYDFKSKKYLRSSTVNPGQDSPVGSSGFSSGAGQGTGPNYQTIHKAKSLSELARLAGG